MVTQINVFVCEVCFKETVVVNKGVDVWSDPVVLPPDGEEWKHIGENFACPSCFAAFMDNPEKWQPGDNVGIKLTDQKTKTLDFDTVFQMMVEVNKIVRAYGFRVQPCNFTLKSNVSKGHGRPKK